MKLNSTVKNTPLQQYGTIKRSSSKNKNESNDRPSTAPQKEYEKTQVTGNSSLKRLPSPNLKCKFIIILILLFFKLEQLV